MGTMYTRKPFSSFRKRAIDPDEILREVKTPTIPPLRAASEQAGTGTPPGVAAGEGDIDGDGAGGATSRWSVQSIRARAGEQIVGSPFATLGAVLAVGALVGTLLGSRFARIASIVAVGALLHARHHASTSTESSGTRSRAGSSGESLADAFASSTLTTDASKLD